MARRSSKAHWTLEDLRRYDPKQAAEFEAQEAARKSGSKYVPPPEAIIKGGWVPATPTHVMWIDGSIRRLASKTEARVAERLISQVKAMRLADAAAKRPLTKLFRQWRIPLGNLDPRPGGCPDYLTVDFCIVHTDGRKELIDAKPKKWKSPEWFRGKLAAQAETGVPIQEVDR